MNNSNSFVNDEKVTVTVTLHGEYAALLLDACKRSKRSRRGEVSIRLEDHLLKNKDFIIS
ncbi:TraY domain-containing protein [Photobacterium damselae]|uniref:Relaxosome protein TraY n=1 Tax=Photobacterium damselae TaxID=38293 RepID=A0A2T3QCQ9_PHODM|nr:TraY domain-containing protein [Photobacterium damselae]PSW82033.1 TraY domain-containing protein [Photobacterium damselae]SPY43732.1 conjugal transfer protein TraY [Photobacterium damselae]